MRGNRFSSALRVGVVLLAVVAAGVLAYDPIPAEGKMGGGGGFGGGKGGGGFNQGGGERDHAAFYFPGYDTNGDGHLDKAEWKRRGNFERLDTDKNGTIEVSELRALYKDWGKKGPMTNPILPSATPEMDGSVEKDRVSMKEVGKETACIITRFGILGKFKCDDGDAIGTAHGLFETGIGPAFPKGAFCHGIDEIFGMDYTGKTGRGMHGGIDLPTDYGTPLLAAAAGTVVGRFEGEGNARGITVVLRHSPKDTGLPFWVFTEYAHMDELPKQVVGQRVKMGEVLGPTGNSGIGQKQLQKGGVNPRRPGVHFAVYYSDGPRFAEVPNYIVPERANWMDSNALYRKKGPYDSRSMKALPDAEKDIPIPVMYLDGAVEPTGTKLIWPYACKRD